MKAIVLSLLLVIGSCYTFDDFIKDYKKSYSEEEYLVRKEIFDSNYTKINEWNSQDNGFQLGITNLTDWTQQEVNRFINTTQDLDSPVSAFPEELEKVAAPMTLSWTNFGKVTPTRNQGSCGSCFAYAVNAALESYILIKQNASVDLSEQFLLECTPYASCGGGSVDYTFMTALSYNNPGVPLESAYPYKAYYGSYSKTAGICLAQDRRTHTKYTTFYRYANVTTAQLKSLIADSPVVVGMASSHYTFSFYKTGIYRCPFNPSVYELDHSVLAIGYDAMGNWLIKNSWGSSWGNGGFGWISNTADCGVKYWAYQVSERKVATYGWNLMGAAIMLLSILLTTSL